MGNKIITEKDFWMCTGGNVPAPLQSVQLSTKKKDGKKYITKVDTATSSYIDFGCNKLMLIMAILAAVVAVAIVATGGAALIAIGALAGAAGAAFGAVLGGLLCGQIAKMARVWLGSKSNMIVQGQPAITGDHEMKCMLFGDTISFAPHIKNWWQAIALAGANYVGGILEGMMAGAAVGMGGAFISGARTAFLQGGTRAVGQAGLQFLKTMPKNFGINAIESFSKFGLGMRGVMGAQNTAATYGNTGTASIGDFAEGTVAMETGAYDSFNNIKEGKGTWQDYVGMAMMVAPVGKGKRDLENEISKKADDAEAKKTDEETTKKAINQEGEAPKKEGDFEAFESPPKPKNSPDIVKWEAKGGKVEVIGDTWRYTDWEGNVVDYKNGYPNFEPHSRQSVDIGKQKGDHYYDYKNAETNSKEIPPKLSNNKTTWHHHEDGKRMIEVDKKIHDRFSHSGGVSKTKKAKLGKK
jgi:hypothetical protein